jgi:hypothetical protein
MVSSIYLASAYRRAGLYARLAIFILDRAPLTSHHHCMANRINDKQPRDMAAEDEMFRDTWSDALGGASWMLCIVIAGAVLMASLLFSGCSAAGDGYSVARMTLSVPDAFTPEQVAATEDARDQWCAANGWCPTIVHGAAGKKIRLTDADPEAKGGGHVAARTYEDEQEIVMWSQALAENTDLFWVEISHEMGHLQGIGHHGPDESYTMFWKHTEPSYTLVGE